jgi:hypothetical protein
LPDRQFFDTDLNQMKRFQLSLFKHLLKKSLKKTTPCILLALTHCGYGLPSPVFPPGAGLDEDLGTEIRHRRQWVWLGSDLGQIRSIQVDLSRTPEAALIMRHLPNLSEWSLEVQLRVSKPDASEKIDRFINESLKLSKLNQSEPVFSSAKIEGVILEQVTLTIDEKTKP